QAARGERAVSRRHRYAGRRRRASRDQPPPRARALRRGWLYAARGIADGDAESGEVLRQGRRLRQRAGRTGRRPGDADRQSAQRHQEHAGDRWRDRRRPLSVVCGTRPAPRDAQTGGRESLESRNRCTWIRGTAHRVLWLPPENGGRIVRLARAAFVRMQSPPEPGFSPHLLAKARRFMVNARSTMNQVLKVYRWLLPLVLVALTGGRSMVAFNYVTD